MRARENITVAYMAGVLLNLEVVDASLDLYHLLLMSKQTL